VATNEKTNDGIQPYIPAEKTVPEATLRAIGIGALLAIVMGAANCYLGLYAGMTVSASIPAAVISMAILRGILRNGTILENNIAQTMASTGESLAAGAIFTIPALLLVGVWKDFEFWPTTAIVTCGGLLGVIFMVPLRRALIVNRPDLIYPEGVACSEVLITGQKGGSGIKVIGLGLGLGAAFKFLVSGVQLLKGTVDGAVAAGSRVFYMGTDISPALLAVGYIVNLHIATLVFLGGAIGWFIALPLYTQHTGDGTAYDTAWDLWSTQIRYIGVGTMLVGAVHSIWNVRSGIVAGVLGLRTIHSGDGDGVETVRTERDLPLRVLFPVLGGTGVATFALYFSLIGNAGVAAIAAIIMIAAAFIFVAVATYIVGLVGGSNSPVSGMTICALLFAAFVLLMFGVKGDSAILATLGVAGVVCCAACTAGDIAQDLKTGQLVGATPKNLQWTELLAVFVSASIFAPVMSLLHNKYVIGSEELAAPQAQLFSSLVNAFFGDGDLPTNMLMYGAAIGVVLIIINTFLERSQYAFRTHVMPVAVGIYLPLSLSVPILLGGLIRHFASNASADPDRMDTDSGVLLGSGLIAGEALMGIGLAIPFIHLTTIGGAWSSPLSLLLFAGLMAVFVIYARKSPSQA